MEESDIGSRLDQLFTAHSKSKPKPTLNKAIIAARNTSNDLAVILAKAKQTCVDRGKDKGECEGREVYKANRCPRHYKIHEQALALERFKQGRESIGDDGFVRTYDEQGNWRLKHRIVMEQKLGRSLDRSEQVIFLDKDKTNCDPDNLLLRNTEVICPHCNKPYTV